MPEIAEKIFLDLFNNGLSVFYDNSGSIGRRYRRQDEIGTLCCITIDSDSLKYNSVTLRNRDNMKQIRVNFDELKTALKRLFNNEKLEKIGKII